MLREMSSEPNKSQGSNVDRVRSRARCRPRTTYGTVVTMAHSLLSALPVTRGSAAGRRPRQAQPSEAPRRPSGRYRDAPSSAIAGRQGAKRVGLMFDLCRSEESALPGLVSGRSARRASFHPLPGGHDSEPTLPLRSIGRHLGLADPLDPPIRRRIECHSRPRACGFGC